MKPTLSIAIPTYNRLPFLRQSLASIKAQTFTDYQVFLFDDGSPEPVEAEARKIIPDLKFIPGDINRGAHFNIERALHYKYETPFVIIFHDDDVMHPRMLDEQVKLLKQFPDAAFVGTNLTFVHDDAKMNDFDPSVADSIEFEHYNSNIELTRAFLRSIHLAFSSVMYRTENLTDDVHLDFETFGPNDDRPFLVSLASSRPSLFIKNKLVNYRQHAAQDSRTNKRSASLLNAPILMSFYRAQLPVPLSFTDKARFFIFSTNALLDSFVRHAGPSDSLNAYVKKAIEQGIFNPLYINHVGLRALMRYAFRKRE